MTTRVLVADDQSMVRAGFRMLLAGEEDIEVVAEASNGLEAIEKAARFDPTVVLMDIRMPEVDGLEATRRILAADRGARILILTTFDLDEYVYEALRAGASGFVLKDDSPEQLLAAIRTVAAGDALLSPTVTRRVIERFAGMPRPAPPTKLEELSEREREVFRLMIRGLSNAEIGHELFISETTVKTHVTHILSKLGLRDRVQAVVLAYQSGLLNQDPVSDGNGSGSGWATAGQAPAIRPRTIAVRRGWGGGGDLWHALAGGRLQPRSAPAIPRSSGGIDRHLQRQRDHQGEQRGNRPEAVERRGAGADQHRREGGGQRARPGAGHPLGGGGHQAAPRRAATARRSGLPVCSVGTASISRSSRGADGAPSRSATQPRSAARVGRRPRGGDDGGDDPLPPLVVGPAEDDRVGDVGMRAQRRLDRGRGRR